MVRKEKASFILYYYNIIGRTKKLLVNYAKSSLLF